MKKSELKQLIKEEIIKVVSEVGPKTAAKAVRSTFTNRSPRSERIMNDAITSLFSKYIGNKKAPFSFITKEKDQLNAPRYELIEVKYLKRDEIIRFYFYNEDGVGGEDVKGPYTSNLKEVNIDYKLKDDEFERASTNDTQIFVNRFTAKFLVGAANKAREMYHTANPKEREIDDPNAPEFSYKTTPTIIDPKFNIKSRYQQANQIPFRQF